ncbi:MAG: phosphatidate cytidylyltransferase [Chitinophagaceae bacterium]
MALQSQVFFTRLASAIVFSAVMLGCMLWNEWSFIVLFAIINVLCLREYTQIIEHILQTRFSRVEKYNVLSLGTAIFFLIISLPLLPCPNIVQRFFNYYFFYFLGLSIGFLILFFSFKKNPKAFFLLTGISYITLALAMLCIIRFQHYIIPIMLMLFIWMNDTMAYLTGSIFGKTKFFPTISPKKTLEGTIGGVLFTVAFAIVWSYYTHWFLLWQWMVLAFIASFFGTIGDLMESKLKRMASIKDSGVLMPGHGGALDRFDSFIFAAPFAFIFCLLWMACQ